MYTKGIEVKFELDETNGMDEQDQIAQELHSKLGGDFWWTGEQLNWADKDGNGIEIQVCPRDEFENFAREKAQENNNPEPSYSEIQYDIDQNYSTLVWGNQEYVLIPQI